MSFYPARFPGVVDFAGGIELDGVSVADLGADGLGLLRVARATYDFAVHGGATGAKNLGVTLPAGALIVGGFVDVITTATTAGADGGTMAIHVQTANDIVSAIAVSAVGDVWDEGQSPIIPKANTPESTAIKLTADRTVTATIAGQAFTAGKFTVYLYYVA